MPEHEPSSARGFSIWSGTITFGLVSVPVTLLPAQRSTRASLRMLAPDGTPLRRRYYCSEEDRLLEPEEIVRGYEIEKGHYVVITDDELAALAPKRSREIDLRLFVPVAQIDPSYFERAYFLAPTGDTIKPYRLLAAAMEASDRAGIATFVMRGKEYLVAILSANGILRAETLRFADEIRLPQDIGLAEPDNAPAPLIERMTAEIRAAAADFDATELADPYTPRLLDVVRKKREQGASVLSIKDRADVADDTEEENNVIDLMEILKRSVGLKETRKSRPSSKS